MCFGRTSPTGRVAGYTVGMVAEEKSPDPDAILADKRDRLLAVLRSLPGVAVAFSGGIDSTVVAKAAFLALGERAVAVTADSASVARAELDDARRLAALIGIRHVVVATREFEDPDYLRNDGSRCYFCKSELYSQGRTPAAGTGRAGGRERGEPGRPRRLPPGPVGGGGTFRPPPLARGGLHQGGRAGAGESLGPADVGQARVALPEQPARSGPGRDAGAHAAG